MCFGQAVFFLLHVSVCCHFVSLLTWVMSVGMNCCGRVCYTFSCLHLLVLDFVIRIAIRILLTLNMRTKGRGKIRPGSHENISLNEHYNANGVGVCVSPEVHPCGYVMSVDPAHQEPTADVLRGKTKLDDSAFHIQRGFPNAYASHSGGRQSMNGEQYFIFPFDYMYTIFFLMFGCHYVCYVLHVVDGLPPLLSPGQELSAYGQSGVVPAIVSGTNGEQYFIFPFDYMYTIFFDVSVSLCLLCVACS